MQARRQSSVTGGAEKYLGAQINFTIILGSEDQKIKRSSSWPLIFFRGTSLAWGARQSLMVRISLFAHKFRGENQKKRSSAQNLRFSLRVHSCFSSWNEILLMLKRGTSSILGGTGPEMHSSGTGPVTFFRGTNLAWRAHFSLGGRKE